jgi:putative Holliday junction resolvase
MQSEAGNLEPPVLRSNRAAVAYNKIQMTTALLSAVRGISVLRSETQPPKVLASRILAIDYGRKRMGLALSDELGLTAQPLDVLVHKNRRDDIRRLREICRENGVRHVLVGHPLHITGEAGEMARETARFAKRLRQELGIAVELADERLTSWEAQQIMNEIGYTGSRKAPTMDAVAAAILLREYLDKKRWAVTGKE